jgi:hypothetical protein
MPTEISQFWLSPSVVATSISGWIKIKIVTMSGALDFRKLSHLPRRIKRSSLALDRCVALAMTALATINKIRD